MNYFPNEPTQARSCNFHGNAPQNIADSRLGDTTNNNNNYDESL